MSFERRFRSVRRRSTRHLAVPHKPSFSREESAYCIYLDICAAHSTALSQTHNEASVLQKDASGGNLSVAGASVWRLSDKDNDNALPVLDVR
jgi:hypothetical protein